MKRATCLLFAALVAGCHHKTAPRPAASSAPGATSTAEAPDTFAGMLSFAIAALYPERIAAAYPMGGMLPPALRPDTRPGGTLPPVVALHGEADPRVPIDEARSAVDALRALGYRAELRPFAGVGHAVPYAMRHELYGLLDAECGG